MLFRYLGRALNPRHTTSELGYCFGCKHASICKNKEAVEEAYNEARKEVPPYPISMRLYCEDRESSFTCRTY